MLRGKQLTEQVCLEINEHHKDGKSNREIGRLLGRSEKAIRGYLKHGTAASATKRTGKKPKIVGQEIRRVVQRATVRNPSVKEISDLLPSNPSKSTVLRVLRSNCATTDTKHA
ncbi:hypothetical protein V7S43_013877 [Phytophthora oleae]|uniref:Tc3 transposase DNA binding domain-containing protein n=1 Tax=Phytophthora oleae TaxID=2107226 RepID=A0ABD3F6Z9_9STRA